jgi:hypothetical protein
MCDLIVNIVTKTVSFSHFGEPSELVDESVNTEDMNEVRF